MVARMQEFPINYLALLVATIIKLVLGMLWYSPLLFGRSWMNLTGCDPKDMKSSMPAAMLVDFVASFLMSFVLLHAVHYAGAQSAAQGAAVGFFNWIGFVAAVTIGSVVYEKRPFKLFLLNNGFYLIALPIMGAVVAVWR
jgi:hypothetical protein